MKTFPAFLAAASFGLMLAACSTQAPAKVADEKPDPRQGKEVKQVCFSSEIRNWRENGRRSVIIEKGVRQEYKLDLIGTCEPDQAFLNIGLKTIGGSSCLTWGDRLITDARFDGSCSIRAIYEWHEPKKVKQSAAAN